MNKFSLFLAAFFICLNSHALNWHELNTNQLQLLTNVLYFSCARIKGEVALQQTLNQIHTSIIFLKQSNNRGKTYKEIIPQLIPQLQQLIKIQEEYDEVCQNHEVIMDNIINQCDTITLAALETIAQELTDTIETKARNASNQIDTILNHCKTELAQIASTFHVMSNACNAISDGVSPILKPMTDARKLDALQQFIPTILQLLQRSLSTLQFIENSMIPYHLAGTEQMKQLYADAYYRLTERNLSCATIIDSSIKLPTPDSLL